MFPCAFFCLVTVESVCSDIPSVLTSAALSAKAKKVPIPITNNSKMIVRGRSIFTLQRIRTEKAIEANEKLKANTKQRC